MLIIGCDYQPGFQQIACVDTDTGELSEQRLAHREEAEAFYGVLGQSESSGASVLDVAPGPRLRPDAKARFARGRARTSRWCAVNHRCNDWASRSQ